MLQFFEAGAGRSQGTVIRSSANENNVTELLVAPMSEGNLTEAYLLGLLATIADFKILKVALSAASTADLEGAVS